MVMNNSRPREWRTAPAIRRHSANPVLSAANVPYQATLVFNAGVCKYQGRYVMVFRNDYGDAKAKRLDGQNQGLAFSADGVHWDVTPHPLFHDDPDHPMYQARDARLTVLDGYVYLTGWFNIDGVVTGIARTEDFETWETVHVTLPRNRNIALFPERIGGRILRLERPFKGLNDRSHIWISASPDGRYWGDSAVALRNSDELFPGLNNKIGPGAPPIRTARGWLCLVHVVDTDATRQGWGWEGDWQERYSAGLMLLDLDDPYKLIGYSRSPVLVPEAQYAYESKGYRDNVIFPGGAILEDSGEVKIYYGAADTVECLASAHVDDLLALCEPV
jgi:beta-1,4-mannooligosaccharide/beta-1,4-mannosyl-N-acetylglucosamine phosphorylase